MIFQNISKINFLLCKMQIVCKKDLMANKKQIFKPPYDFKDVGVLFSLIALLLIISALFGNYLFGIFQNSFF